MDATLTTLQELVLDIVAHEHATVTNIEPQVLVLLGNGVSRQQIADALQTLRDAGLVDAFVAREADGALERYRRPKPKAGLELWWRATDRGLQVNAAGVGDT